MPKFSFTTLEIDSKDVIAIKTTVELVHRLEIGDWAHCNAPSCADVIIFDPASLPNVIKDYSEKHALVSYTAEQAPSTLIHTLSPPATYTKVVALFKQLEDEVLARRRDSCFIPPQNSSSDTDTSTDNKDVTTSQETPAIDLEPVSEPVSEPQIKITQKTKKPLL